MLSFPSLQAGSTAGQQKDTKAVKRLKGHRNNVLGLWEEKQKKALIPTCSSQELAAPEIASICAEGVPGSFGGAPLEYP